MTPAGSSVKAKGTEAVISSFKTETMTKIAVIHWRRGCPMLTNALGRTGILFSWSFVRPVTVIQACVLVLLASCYSEFTVLQRWGK